MSDISKTSFSQKFKNFFKNLFKRADKLMYPPNIKCLCCYKDLPQKQEIEICNDCLKKIRFIDESCCCRVCGTYLKQTNICSNCSKNKRNFDIARSVCVYDDIATKLIVNFKFNGAPYMHKTLANMMAEKYLSLKWNCDEVLFVPLTPKKQKARGFNQTELLAKHFCEKLNIPLLNNVIIKTKDTKQQSNLGFVERQENIKQSFKVINKKEVKGKNILIIDDVFTTGATSGAISHTLKQAGAKKIYVLTFASTELKAQFEFIKNDKKDK